jgi:dihydroneopterin aldolase
MNKVIINNIRIYSGHGVLEQEKSVGAYYTVDVEIETDFHAAMKNDELDGTIDYSEVYKIICDEMSVPSKLIENVSYRIISKIFTNFSKAKNVVLKILKENPPMGAECLGAGVEIDIDREEFLLL